ncbi:hypothetical protein ABZ667_42710 [Streptomyces lavendulae]|uniref:hypothetical protein n=1 Tax=Streptomyces lavendulae TaxID=1914 RepID=UPI0033D4DF34
MSVYTQPTPAHFVSAGQVPMGLFPQTAQYQPSLFPQTSAATTWPGSMPSIPPVAQVPLLTTDVSLRCAATALNTVIEQLRVDPQLLTQIQAQGQLPQHAWSSILTECARRVAPVIHTLINEVSERQHLFATVAGFTYGQPSSAFPATPFASTAFSQQPLS